MVCTPLVACQSPPLAGKNTRQRKYIVQWKGLGADHNELLPKNKLTHCKRLLRKYKRSAGLLITESDGDSSDDE
jgi:hypothetical protein